MYLLLVSKPTVRSHLILSNHMGNNRSTASLQSLIGVGFETHCNTVPSGGLKQIVSCNNSSKLNAVVVPYLFSISDPKPHVVKMENFASLRGWTFIRVRSLNKRQISVKPSKHNDKNAYHLWSTINEA